MPIGDHLISNRSISIFKYTHHGIDLGRGRVLHYSGLANGPTAGKIEITTLRKFSKGKSFTRVSPKDRAYTSRDAVLRAISRLGEDEYCVLTNNCEHLAEWSINGRHRSRQVDRGLTEGVARARQVSAALLPAGPLGRALAISIVVAATVACGATTKRQRNKAISLSKPRNLSSVKRHTRVLTRTLPKQIVGAIRHRGKIVR
ncbi:MAG: hypothetical protein CFE46_18315 [Burkholderiales bacterium PBB6]|nr:MAG: hypothetical protein CFE46_18315 [Burkholderiales bacterium PBB6]